MENSITKIIESMESFSKQELVVAKYVLKNIKKVSLMTITELAENSKSSTATVVRFWNTLGYSGFREFIKSFYHDAMVYDKKDNLYEVDNELDSSLSLNETINLVSKLNIESIENTLSTLDFRSIEKAVQLINNANKVSLYALSGSIVVAEDALFKFERLGINCEVLSNSHSQILSASTLKKGDVAIAISYSGNTKDIIEAVKYAKETKGTVIAITKFGDSALSNLADITIKHASVGKGSRTYSMRSRVVQLNIIDILFILLCRVRKAQLKKYYDIFNKEPIGIDK